VATLGTACTAEHVQKLLRFTEQVVFSFDGDAAGRRAAGRALEAALPHATDTRSFRFLFLPPEHDPDSYVREFGAEAFENFVRNAVPLSRQLLDHAAADCELGSAEGRARMLAQAKPLWQALPEGALRAQLLGELAIRGGLPADELARLWQAGGPRQRAESDPPWAGDEPSGERKRRWHRKDEGDGLPRPTGRCQPPKRPEDRVVQMLFGQPAWWHELPADEHDLLHQLPAPHGTIVAWLERELAEHGARPWAVIREALAADEALDAEARALADGDADPDATPADLRRAVDVLVERHLAARMKALLAEAAQRREALDEYRELDKRWRDVKMRLSAAPATE
jgi:DNA primase